MANETVHAIGNEATFDTQGEILLGVGCDHDGAAQDADANAQAEPGIIRER